MARRVEEGVFNATHASPADGFRPPAIPRRRPGPDSGPDPGHGARRDGRQSRQVEAQGGLGRPPGASSSWPSRSSCSPDADYEGEIVQHPGSRRLPDAPRRERRRLGQPVPAPLTSGPRTGMAAPAPCPDAVAKTSPRRQASPSLASGLPGRGHLKPAHSESPEQRFDLVKMRLLMADNAIGIAEDRLVALTRRGPGERFRGAANRPRQGPPTRR